MIKSPDFWVQTRFIADIGLLAEHASRWAEGCRCCDTHRTIYLRASRQDKRMLPQPSCPYQGCRAPELAAGECFANLNRAAKETEPVLQQYVHEATSPEMVSALCTDWQRAIATVMSTMLLKLILSTSLFDLPEDVKLCCSLLIHYKS